MFVSTVMEHDGLDASKYRIYLLKQRLKKAYPQLATEVNDTVPHPTAYNMANFTFAWNSRVTLDSRVILG